MKKILASNTKETKITAAGATVRFPILIYLT